MTLHDNVAKWCKMHPTKVSHLDVVVGICSDDPKDFYSLEDRSVLKADQIRENIYFTLPVLCAGFVFIADYGFIAVYLRPHSRYLLLRSRLRLYRSYL